VPAGPTVETRSKKEAKEGRTGPNPCRTLERREMIQIDRREGTYEKLPLYWGDESGRDQVAKREKCKGLENTERETIKSLLSKEKPEIRPKRTGRELSAADRKINKRGQSTKKKGGVGK